MKKISLLLAWLLIAVVTTAHPWKPRHYLIVDTDGSDNDLAALTMLLASPDVRVLAVTVSSGTLQADSAYKKVSKLLRDFHHEGMLIGIEKQINPISGIQPSVKDNITVINRVLSYEESALKMVCLGGLKTASDLLNMPVNKQRIKQVIWSGDSASKQEFNENPERRSVEIVIKSGIPLAMIGEWKGEFIDTPFVKSLQEGTGIYQDYLSRSLTMEIDKSEDELVPVFIHYPELFIKNNANQYLPDLNKKDDFKSAFLKIASGETAERNQVVNKFPSDPSFYFPDLEPYVSRIMEAYGQDEWTSGVLASELHRHLGSFAIIGVKMGIRAREYFNTGVDEFMVLSYAGSTPPLSCLNDGLQVSTGATPGHGLLKVEDKGLPSVEIKYKDRQIRISLKPEIADTISAELKQINFIYGLDSDIYWELVRKNTIKYWLDLDRHDIFLIEEL